MTAVSTYGPCERCHHCESGNLEWAGYSKRALRRSRPSPDVRRCRTCGRAWYYGRWGKRIPTRRYVIA